MKTQKIGKSNLTSTRLAYGCWRLAGTWNPAEVTAEKIEIGKKAVLTAYEAGYTFFDNADIYCVGQCETIHGQVLREVRGMKERVSIATKCGIRFAGSPEPTSPQRYDFSADYIQGSCEQSLKRLGIERIDLYQLHRPDLLMDPQEVAGAFDKLKQQGKVREFGISNFTPSQVTALQRACPMPLIVNQIEINLARLAPFHDGTLDQCLTEHMTPLAWSPLAGGLFGTGAQVPANHPRGAIIQATQDMLDKTAKAHGTTRTVIALAWLLKHPAHIIPIVGTTNPARIREALKADEIDLPREDWYRILLAARGEPLP